MQREQISYLNIINESDTIQGASSGILKVYFSGNKNRKGKLVSDTGLAYTHITKFEMGDFVKKPYFDTIALIFGKHILSKEDFKKLSEKFYPECVIEYLKDFPKPFDENEKINKLIRDKTGSIIFQLINSREGSTRKKIKDLYHDNGINLLDPIRRSHPLQLVRKG